MGYLPKGILAKEDKKDESDEHGGTGSSVTIIEYAEEHVLG